MSGPILSARGIEKSFKDNHVLRDIDLDVCQGEVVTIIGPSGTGKTTFLRTLNWLDRPDAGTIEIDGVRADARSASKRDIAALRSKTAMVFQHYNLFRNKSALDNVTAALRYVQHLDRAEAERRGRELLDRVGLADKAGEYPAMLSGGQQQRVGIARALAVRPSVILFDEPTSALDPEWVGEVLQVMHSIAEDGMTMMVVSHEMRFVRSIATRVVYLDEGKVLEDGTPGQVFNHPRTKEARRFLGQAHLT